MKKANNTCKTTERRPFEEQKTPKNQRRIRTGLKVGVGAGGF